MARKKKVNLDETNKVDIVIDEDRLNNDDSLDTSFIEGRRGRKIKEAIEAAKVLEAEGISLGEDSVPEIFFANIGEAAKVYAFTLAEKARAEGMRAQSDLMGRSLKAQMKYADKIKAIYTVVLGDDEVANLSAVAKNMITKEQITLDLTKSIREQLK